MAVSLQSTVFWVVTPCNLEFSRNISTPSSRWKRKNARKQQKQATRLDIEDGGGMSLRNMGLFVNYEPLLPRKSRYSCCLSIEAKSSDQGALEQGAEKNIWAKERK